VHVDSVATGDNQYSIKHPTVSAVATEWHSYPCSCTSDDDYDDNDDDDTDENTGTISFVNTNSAVVAHPTATIAIACTAKTTLWRCGRSRTARSIFSTQIG
jgi:hypothetical protein